MDEIDELIQDLRESARYLEMRGIDRGCQDSSISAGLANRAADTIEALAKPASSPAGGGVGEVIERLRKPIYNEELMQRWDRWRRLHKEGFGGSATRDEFESIIDHIDEERKEAAEMLAALSQSTSAGRVGE